jgi:hypothetical protein
LTDLIVEIEQIDLDIEAKKQELLALESKKEDFTKQKQEFEEKIDAPVNSNSNRSQRSFNLSKAVSAIVNGHPFDEVESRYINVGKQKADASGLSYNGQIVLPIGESRDVQAKTGLGLETIETEVLPIIDPLRNNLVLAKAGATIMTGLKGNIQIPIY